MAGPYRQCPTCGSNNDPGEKCTCNGIKPKPQRKKRKKKADKTATNRTSEIVFFTKNIRGTAYTFGTYKVEGSCEDA